ncbi:MAG: hypothetical protein LCH39_04055 [Proteobacteria bacterium]|nr:hypothetical protein [Pseudomonadota bacterium]
MRRLIVALSVAAALCVSVQANAQSQDEEIALTEKAKDLVSRSLKDPSSAQFRDVYLMPKPKGGKCVCGWVNSKNSFGGYVGFRRFISDGTADLTTMDEDSPLFGALVPFNELWAAFCKK